MNKNRAALCIKLKRELDDLRERAEATEEERDDLQDKLNQVTHECDRQKKMVKHLRKRLECVEWQSNEKEQ